MKLLFLVSSMEGGGAERVAAMLCSAWAERGETVTLMPTFSGRGGVSYPLSDRVRLEFLADHVASRTGRLARILALRRHIRTTRPDVIISFLPHVNIAALISSFGTRVPVIACERTYPPLLKPPLPLPYRMLRRVFYPRAGVLVGQSTATRGWFSKKFPGSPTVIIPNHVKIPVPRAMPEIQPTTILGHSRNALLSVGRLDSSKRPDLLVGAFADVAPDFPDWDLVILGDGAARPDLEALVSRLGLSHRIHLPGRAGNVSDWYERAQVFCLPSSYEGFPNALLEAMASGLPAIAFDIMTGPREIMDGGRRGILLPDNNQRERLGAALRESMTNPKMRAELAGQAPEIRTTYSLENILKMWDDAIETVTSARK